VRKIPKKITLKQLVALCFKEPKLFPKLCKNVNATLSGLDRFLDPADLEYLIARIAELSPAERELIQWMLETLTVSVMKYDPKKPPLWP
jgi:hypothetical protein